jgi:protein SCO1/2
MKNTKILSLVNLLILGTATAGLPPVSTNQPACCAKGHVESGPASDRSLYQVDSAWTDDAAHQVKLGSLAGRPQIVTMFFSSCNFACPILVHDLKRIEAALPQDLRGKVGFTLITFDSDHDSPRVLAAFRNKHELGGNWTLLRGEPDDVLEIAALLGVKFKKDARGQFAHSNIISVLNSEGEIVYQEIGLNRDSTPTVQAVQKAFSAPAH